MCDSCRLGKHRECVSPQCDCWHWQAAADAARQTDVERTLGLMLRLVPDRALDLVAKMRRLREP